MNENSERIKYTTYKENLGIQHQQQSNNIFLKKGGIKKHH